jgi:uncharacterized membrane protein YqiK
MYTQGLGKPRMSSGERVLDMMAQLDEHSDKIPEGMYLQFCDHLKFFYQNDENIKKRLEAERRADEMERRRTVRLREVAETERRLAIARAWEAGWADAERLAVETRRRLANAREREAEREAERGSRRCGCCRQLGHNRRTCPQRVQ